MARTDALAVEGLSAALDRAYAYAQAGADFLFAKPSPTLTLCWFARASGLPVLANRPNLATPPADRP
jgi:methylisocitrate lyase